MDPTLSSARRSPNGLPPDVQRLLASLTQSVIAIHGQCTPAELRAIIAQRLETRMKGYEQQVENLDRALRRAASIAQKAAEPRRHALKNIEQCETLRAYLDAQREREKPDNDE